MGLEGSGRSGTVVMPEGTWAGISKAWESRSKRGTWEWKKQAFGDNWDTAEDMGWKEPASGGQMSYRRGHGSEGAGL